MQKIHNVIELARYKLGATAWWVTLEAADLPDLEPDENWMQKAHPKALYGGPYRQSWRPVTTRLPSLKGSDFNVVVGLLTSKLIIKEFNVCNVKRSVDTGEFLYVNEDKVWMPESYLMDSKAAAIREKRRILKMMTRWIAKNSE
jgi:hypothetical protein